MVLVSDSQSYQQLTSMLPCYILAGNMLHRQRCTLHKSSGIDAIAP
jgi:hypothetical protein